MKNYERVIIYLLLGFLFSGTVLSYVSYVKQSHYGRGKNIRWGEMQIPCKKTFEATLEGGGKHIFREVRIGDPRKGELYLEAAGRVVRSDCDHRKAYDWKDSTDIIVEFAD